MTFTNGLVDWGTTDVGVWQSGIPGILVIEIPEFIRHSAELYISFIAVILTSHYILHRLLKIIH